MGMTMAEKVLARVSGKRKVRPGEYVTANVDQVMCHDGFGNAFGRIAGANAAAEKA